MLHDRPGVLELMRGKKLRDLGGGMPYEEEPSSMPPGMDDELIATLKHKRRSTLLKSQLREGGYGELAKMLAIHDKKGE